MKIAFYNPINVSFMSGPEVWITKMLPLLSKMGFDVTLYTTKFKRSCDYKNIYRKLEKEGVKIIELNYFLMPLSGSMIPWDFIKYAKKNYDYLYFFNGFAFQDLIAYFMSKIFRAKFIYSIHAPIITNYFLHNIYQKVISSNIIRLSSKIHVVNRRDKIKLAFLNKKTFIVAPGPGNDFSGKFTKKNMIKKINDDTCRIIFLGRLSPQKNISKLLKVIQSFSDDKKIKFYISGRGEQEADVINYTHRYYNLDYLGFVKTEDIPKVYSDKHYFINLSVYETFCVTIIEAMSLGIPVISTCTQGICSDCRSQSPIASLPIDFKISDAVKKINQLKELYFEDKKRYKYLSSEAIRTSSLFNWDIQSKKFVSSLLDT